MYICIYTVIPTKGEETIVELMLFAPKDFLQGSILVLCWSLPTIPMVASQIFLYYCVL